VENDLPSVIRMARRRLGEARARKMVEEAIYTPSPDMGSYGWMDRYRLPAGYSEDVDVHRGPYTVELLEKLEVRLPIGGYILHMPCKLDRSYIESFRRVFGREDILLESCLGGGGLDLIAPRLLKMLPRIPGDKPVITQCGRAAIKMRSMGIEAYTPLEVYIGGSR